MRHRAFAAFALLAGAAVVCANQEGTLLRLKIQPNTVDTYKVTSVSKQTVTSQMAPAQDVEFTSSSDYMMRYGALGPDGKADVTLEVSNIKMESNAPIPTPPTSEDMKFTAKIDDRYRLSDVNLGEAADPLVAQLTQTMSQSMAMFALPEKPVKPGDTWEIMMPDLPMLGLKARAIKAKFEGEREVDGKAHHVITIEDTFPVDMDASKTSQGAIGLGEMPMKGTNTVKMELLFDAETGKMVSSEGTTESDLKMTIVAMGAEMDIKGTTTTSMKLVR